MAVPLNPTLSTGFTDTFLGVWVHEQVMDNDKVSP